MILRCLVGLLFLIFNIFPFHSFSQVNYNSLNFNVQDNCESDQISNRYCLLDQRFTINGINSLVLTGDSKFNIKKESSLFTVVKKVVIPKFLKGKTISISTKVLNNSLGRLSLKAMRLDHEENFFDEKIIFVDQNTKLSELKITFPLRNVGMLNIAINFVGILDGEQSVIIEDLEIKIDGKSLRNIEPKAKNDQKYFASFTKDEIKALDTSSLLISLGSEHRLLHSKIIGLGEAAHGSKSISELRYSFLKELIERNITDLILLEVPTDMGLILEAYAQGYLCDTTSLVRQYSKILYQGESLIAFLKWVRQHNLTTTSKVHVFGIDNNTNLDNEIMLMDLHRELLGDVKALPYLRLLNKRDLNAAKELAIKDSILTKTYGQFFFKNYLLTLSERSVYSFDDIFIERDKMMFNRVLKIDSLFNQMDNSLVILTHSNHLRKKPVLDYDREIMLGGYLANYYKNQFYNLNFTFGSGQFLQDSSKNRAFWAVETLTELPPESFEFFAFNSKNNFLFYATEDVESAIVPSLSIKRNTQYLNHFYITNPKKNFDGFIFLRNSKVRDDFEPNAFRYLFNLFQNKSKIYRDLLK